MKFNTLLDLLRIFDALKISWISSNPVTFATWYSCCFKRRNRSQILRGLSLDDVPFEHFSARPCRRLSLFLDVCGSQSLAMKTNSTKRVHWVHIVSLSLTSEILLYSSLIRSSASYEMKSFRNQRRPVWIYLIGFDWSTYWAPSLKASAARTML